jgi:hypothetical protein
MARQTLAWGGRRRESFSGAMFLSMESSTGSHSQKQQCRSGSTLPRFAGDELSILLIKGRMWAGESGDRLLLIPYLRRRFPVAVTKVACTNSPSNSFPKTSALNPPWKISTAFFGLS